LIEYIKSFSQNDVERICFVSNKILDTYLK